MKFEKRTILISRGSSGIGYELAKQLLERWNVVIIAGRNQEKLESTRRALPVFSCLGKKTNKETSYERLPEGS